jgi:hypothetical protein
VDGKSGCGWVRGFPRGCFGRNDEALLVRRRIGKCWRMRVERFEQSGRGEFFGILHCVQDDGRNLQQQRPLRSGRRELATAKTIAFRTAGTCNGKDHCVQDDGRTCNGKDHCVQDDGRNLQRQRPLRSGSRQELATAKTVAFGTTAGTCNGRKRPIGNTNDMDSL